MTAPKTQLEIAAQWLKDAAMQIGGKDAFQFSRVANECLAVARGIKGEL